ncbi:alkaline phosphatase PhoX [Streptomyces sp. NPDC001292]|uniref:alkaline phosphatase PhoX n=1 Tax=Streptomyces sp. NPDC001292 TaxID=3364558 RepID=UPI003698B253
MVDSARNFRVTGATPVAFSGPVPVDHPLLRTGAAPLGTLGNSHGGMTPWGTYLTCEENADAVFGTEDPTWVPSEAQRRHGLSMAGHVNKMTGAGLTVDGGFGPATIKALQIALNRAQ